MSESLLAERNFLPSDIEVSNWQQIESYFKKLLDTPLNDLQALKQWLRDRSELEAFLQEDLGWRYIRMSCDTANEEYAGAFNFFVGEIQPRIAPLSQQLDLKLLNSTALPELSGRPYEIMLRQVRKRVEIFREVNIPLIAELQQKEQEYSAITGAMTVEVDGKEMTLQQAANFLEQDNRERREEVYRKVFARRLQDKDRLDELMDDLVARRDVIARNADFSNYRDYMFASLGRFDYTPDDCLRFHDAIGKFVVSLNNEVEEQHRKELGLDTLKPWDAVASPKGQEPLRPFSSAEDLMAKTIACFRDIDPFLGECMIEMQQAGRLDLESRKGKAPGGYNYPLYETGLPFIFMNSTNTLRDLVTMVHEGGHAVQSIVDKPLDLVDFKNLPSEVAELASMSMELISMEHWQHFFSNPLELKRARRKHLEDVLKGLPWIACVDAFQHWMYTHPGHRAGERSQAWTETYLRFSGHVTDWSGLEEIRSLLWQKQLHIYEVPFYYVEYGFAQLGAIAVWRNYRLRPAETIRQYLDALKLGYTASIGEVYEKAGIRFDFSDDYIRELTAFVREEWKKLCEE
ncbi:MAG: M3 family oligoendopeptidase [Bacteroidia bacterium]|nr:M3 family oligoendopeptidase [Bacteroidia bacterium]